MSLDFNQQVIEEFRANGGKVGGYFEGARLLLITTTGARSGLPHTVPVGYLPDGDRALIIGSAGGSPKHPAWFHNLRANPSLTVEDGTMTYEAKATVLEGAERDELWARAVEADQGWADYQAKTTRVLPVVAIESVHSGPPNVNADTPGGGLKAIHDAFRRELGLIRGEVAASGPKLGAQLRVNCLTFCGGLTYHHTAEDGGIFPFLMNNHPELAPVVERLEAEHVRIAALLEQLQAAVTGDGGQALAEVDRLIGELEAHLVYEEEHLIPILNAAMV
jgi:deazaflavin-dependent oxidoreductase (nitroreductase family)